MEQPSQNPPEFALDGVRLGVPGFAGEATEQHPSNEEISVHEPDPERGWLDDTGVEIIRATRRWIQYGVVGFAVVFIVIGAVEALFGR